MDPLGLAATKEIFDDNILYSDDVDEAIKYANIIVLINPEKYFIKAIEESKPLNQVTIIDCWRVLDKTRKHENIKLIRIGEFI